MATAKIVNAKLTSIDPNPFRLTKKYPYVDSKIDALTRSMKHDDIGCWEGVIARKRGGRYQIAFGHHRVQAAKKIRLKSVPLIIRDLNDREMVQFMGRENLDDYAVSFPVLLETWEAAERYLSKLAETGSPQVMDIARLLGWIRPRATGRQKGQDTLTNIASACNSAHNLIKRDYLDRHTLDGLSVTSARKIVERAWSRVEQLDRIAKKDEGRRTEMETAKKHVGRGAATVARKVRKGVVSPADVGRQVDSEAYSHARKAKKKNSPLFAAFGMNLANSIEKMVNNDSASVKLASVVQALGMIEMESDKDIVKRLQVELRDLEKRAGEWRKKLGKKPRAVKLVK